MTSELTSTPKGDLIIPADQLGKLKGVDPATLRIDNLGDDLLISARPQPGERPQALLYGDLRLFHSAELIALISSMHKDGSLSLLVPHGIKKIFFSKGEVVFATSSVEDDRLGEVLWRRGFLTLEQLCKVHDLVTPQKKMGAIMVEKGLITPRQLYEGIKEQTLEIVYSTFHFRKGEFLFVEGGRKPRDSVRLTLSTREVIREGIRRVEEMTHLEELFPNRKMVLVRRPVAVDAPQSDPERLVYQLINGERSVGAVMGDSRLGEFEALKALAKLGGIGLIDIIEPAIEERQEVSSLPAILEEYSKLLGHIHRTLKEEEPGSESRLEAYLGSPDPHHRRTFLNVGFDAEGRLDMDTLYRNAREANPDNPREVALKALRGLYDYARFQAMDVLDGEVCDALMERLEAMRSDTRPGS